MNVHIIGIKGWGTSALAQILKARGESVCGSDTTDYVPSDPVLKRAGIVVEPFAVDTITKNLDRVIYSTAGYDEDHPERKRASELGIPQLSYAEAVAQLFNAQQGISVCGTHGKTTSSAMITFVLKNLGIDPTAIIGSIVPQFGSNALAGSSPYFVLESDEYQNKLKYYYPKTVLLTSVEWDHPDFFHSEEEYKDVFRSFLKHEGIMRVIACVDDPGVRDVIQSYASSHTYGEDLNAEYRMADYRSEKGKAVFSIVCHANTIGECATSLFGKHNALNALGVFAVCDLLGVGSRPDILRSISAFQGTERRCEYKGHRGNTEVYVDYGHHPTEVRVTLAAFRERNPDKKITCVFGPHTFSRTAAFLDSFAHSFASVDQVFMFDIYGAREKEGTVHARDVVEAINTVSHNANYSGSINDTLLALHGQGDTIDVLVCMGASEDVWKVAELFLKNEL